MLDIGASYGLVQKAGSWYSLNDVRIGQGRDKAREWLLENPAERDALRQAILAAAGIGASAAPAKAAPAKSAAPVKSEPAKTEPAKAAPADAA